MGRADHARRSGHAAMGVGHSARLMAAVRRWEILGLGWASRLSGAVHPDRFTTGPTWMNDPEGRYPALGTAISPRRLEAEDVEDVAPPRARQGIAVAGEGMADVEPLHETDEVEDVHDAQPGAGVAVREAG